MITCYDSNGKIIKTLYQWDTNRIITLRGEDFTDVIEVHLSHEICGTATTVLPLNDGTALLNNNTLSFIIPDALLQIAKPLIVYLYRNTPSDEDMTSGEVRIPIRPRARPTDYEDKEAEREAAELQREQNELLRIANENTRRAAEEARVAKEQSRVNAELARQAKEDERMAAELQRIANEQERIAHGTVFIAEYGVTTFAEIQEALGANKAVICRKREFIPDPLDPEVQHTVYTEGILDTNYTGIGARFIAYPNFWACDEETSDWTQTSMLSSTLTSDTDTAPSNAAVHEALNVPPTDETAGMVKTNTAEGIATNDDGQLAIDGRFGQADSGGLYYPPTAEPTSMGEQALLITDGAKGLSAASRTLALMSGAGLTCKSAPAGSTVYRVTNNYYNRFIWAAVAMPGSRLALNADDAATNGTAEILSVKYADGRDCIPYPGPAESNNDIIITVDRTVNPDAATTKLRAYGNTTGDNSVVVGQGVSGHNKSLVVGQSCRTTTLQGVAVGNSVYIGESNSFGFGRFIYIPQQFCFATGEGHYFTDASAGAVAVGKWSVIDADTAMAVGNGDRQSPRNALEVKNSGDVVIGGGVILTSPNGTEFDLRVDDNGVLNRAGDRYIVDEEQLIGEWIEGGNTYNLYRKVVDCGALTNSAEKRIPHNIETPFTITRISGVARTSGNTLPLPFAAVDPSKSIYLAVGNSNVTITPGSDRSAYTASVIIEYYKLQA